MDERLNHTNGRAAVALGTMLLLLCAAGVGAVTGWIALQVGEARQNTTFRIPPACSVCGVVEMVRELETAARGASEVNWVERGLGVRPADLLLGGGRADAIVVLLAALGGTSAGTVLFPARTFETAVRLDDGSVRVLRESAAPRWQPGDRVRVLRGRIEPPV